MIETINDTVFIAQGLSNYQNYAFYIRSVDIFGNISQPSDTITVQPCLLVTDVDGNSYNTVKTGEQYWFKENLKVTYYRDTSAILNEPDGAAWAELSIGAWCYYDNSVANGDIYGALYNWYAVDTGMLCPLGWHVPTDAEWYTLENFVDSTINDPNTEGWRGSIAGTELKTATGWNNNGNGNDNYGFSALPNAFRNDAGAFGGLGDFNLYWASTLAYDN